MQEKSELPSPLTQVPALPNSSEVYDFLYIDKPRIALLYAQLFKQGAISTVKTVTSSGSVEDSSFSGGLPKVMEAATKTSDIASEAIERMFDATHAIPIEVLLALYDRNLLKDFEENLNIGGIYLQPGYLKLIDSSGMKALWDATLPLFDTSDGLLSFA